MDLRSAEGPEVMPFSPGEECVLREGIGSWLGGLGSGAKGNRLRPAEAAAFCHTYEALQLGGFWSTDEDGCMTYLSEALAEALSPGEMVIGVKLLELFRTEQAGDSAKSSLPMAVARRGQFDRVVVQTGSGKERRWWSISGKARLDAGDKFSGFLGHCADITAERVSVEENEELAQKDALTGLLNRRKMSEMLDRQITNCKYSEQPCALLLIDLDRFKQVNDTLGHSAGDAILKQVADRLVAIVGDKDKICRLGGDEFQIVLPDSEDRGELGDLASAIISGLSQPYSVDGNRCAIGASVGVAVSPFDGETSEELVRNADLALYAAKHGGRGRFRFFSGELLRAAEDRRKLEEDLLDAVAKGELELNYQPIVDARTNTVTGAETLVRWKHPEMGYISPAVFIPIAEESSLIGRIGEWVMRKACEDAANWPARLRVAVNVSPVQFADAALPAIVTNALASSGLNPERLELEITETVFVQQGNGTDAMFKSLKGLGVRLALDDFGTGYSSLSYLKSAPFDKIKIDQSFVSGATEKGSRNKAIIAAIVALAEAVDMETTAEGVETHDQLEMIRELKVSHVQGYIYSQPQTNEDFVGHLQDGSWVIEPEGLPFHRQDRFAMYRTIGTVHEDHYYSVVLRNLSKTGALIEGLREVPLGTEFVLDFGEGQLMVSVVRRMGLESQGVEFETPLVDDGNGGLCTRHRVSPYHLAMAGLPSFVGEYRPEDFAEMQTGKIQIPAFSSKQDWLKIAGRNSAAA
ncbi:MAG: EAL domain-containing protein [Novosphingobium sp.]|nr:EAL domain-containing protein [Novosphingobium sp.]